jgi:aminoglycoside phosphotransferase (APT) family kinase protein
VWVHGDLAPSNVLVAGRALHAVIDFGGAAIGDPACDLAMEWTFFTGDSAAAFRRGLRLDEATWARGRGWALWKALVSLGEGNGRGGDAQDAARRTIGSIIADHARTAGG